MGWEDYLPVSSTKAWRCTAVARSGAARAAGIPVRGSIRRVRRGLGLARAEATRLRRQQRGPHSAGRLLHRSGTHVFRARMVEKECGPSGQARGGRAQPGSHQVRWTRSFAWPAAVALSISSKNSEFRASAWKPGTSRLRWPLPRASRPCATRAFRWCATIAVPPRAASCPTAGGFRSPWPMKPA